MPRMPGGSTPAQWQSVTERMTGKRVDRGRCFAVTTMRTRRADGALTYNTPATMNSPNITSMRATYSMASFVLLNSHVVRCWKNLQYAGCRRRVRRPRCSRATICVGKRSLSSVASLG